MIPANCVGLAKQIAFFASWRPTRKHIRICFRSMFFNHTPFTQPEYQDDQEYKTMSACEKDQFVKSLVYPNFTTLRFVDNRVVLDDLVVCTLPHTKTKSLRSHYLANSIADPIHMYMCIACVFMGYKFCKNYITLFVRKYPFVDQDVTNANTYTLYEFDAHFGSAGVFTDRVCVHGKYIYTPIHEIAEATHAMGACVIVPNINIGINTGTGTNKTVELSDGRRIYKISIVEYKDKVSA